MIPALTTSLVLPPFVGENATQRADTSPYLTTLSDVALRFGRSLERVEILRGLIVYRSELRRIGMTDGWQWLDGSFLEDVEAIRMRPPADIDLVTFARVPGDSTTKRQLAMDNIHLFNATQAKARYKCDAYIVDLNTRAELLVDDTRYWFGLFSHQRVTSLWKGMLKVPLSDPRDEHDLAASGLLDAIAQEIGGSHNAQET